MAADRDDVVPSSYQLGPLFFAGRKRGKSRLVAAFEHMRRGIVAHEGRPARKRHIHQIIEDEIAALEAAGMLDRPDYANSLIHENPKDI